MTEKTDDRPITVKLATWWGFAFAGMFILYGGVQIILGVLDNHHDNLARSVIFSALGVALITIVYAFKESKVWGWYALIAINGLIVVGALFSIQRYESVILIVIAAGALYSLLARPTKEYLSVGR